MDLCSSKATSPYPMTKAEIRIDIPDGRWIQEVSTNFSDASFRVLSVMTDGKTGVGTLEVKDEDVESVLEDIETKTDILSFDILYMDDKTAVAQFEINIPTIYFAAKESGAPPNTPFEIHDGEVRMRITAPRDRISDFVGKLEERNIGFNVSYMKDVDFKDTLTEKQRVLIDKGVEMGYYDTPRRCSLTELAEECGIAKSTCSDTLHRAEENIMKEFVDGWN